MKLLILLLIPCSIPLSATPLRKVISLATSAMTVYPMLKSNYDWAQSLQQSDAICAELGEIDPALEQFVRAQLQAHGYANAQTLAIKLRYDDANMATVLDHCLTFSHTYAAEITAAITATNPTPEQQRELQLCRINLDHEMHHIQARHAQKSIIETSTIPILVELTLLPVTTKLVRAKYLLTFAAGTIASIPCKLGLYQQLELAHRKRQEQQADQWCWDQNNHQSALKLLLQNRKHIIRSGFADLYFQHAQYGQSGSLTFNVLTKLLKTVPEKIDPAHLAQDSVYAAEQLTNMQQAYRRFKHQPMQWPLRLLHHVYDPEHNFVLDDAKLLKKRLGKLQIP